MNPPLPVAFVATLDGAWRIDGIVARGGEPLPPAARLAVVEGPEARDAEGRWVLRGVAGHERYVERGEHEALAARQVPLGRPEARCAALIAVRKSPPWWEMAQDERRGVLEASHHIAIGMEYPAVARRLHHSRDLGEPFDFLTWFEYPPAEEGSFDELLARLRETPEWAYVEHEVDVRVSR